MSRDEGPRPFQGRGDIIEIYTVSPVHRRGTVGEYAAVYGRLQSRDFMWSHMSLNHFGLYFPVKKESPPVRILIDHRMGIRLDEMESRSAQALTDLTIQEVAGHLAFTMPHNVSCTCSLYGRPCSIGEFLIEGTFTSS